MCSAWPRCTLSVQRPRPAGRQRGEHPQDIDAIRVRAGLAPTTISDNNYQAFRLEIESQRMKEFAFEGHRWFDLVRTNRAQAVLENVNSVDQTLFPIPLTEILANDNPGMVQNPGY
jgi:starch-binding outer membrane protein, SusD/RagB family